MNPAIQHWWAQRLTAVILTPLCLWFVFSLAGAAGMEHAAAQHWIGTPVNSLLLIVFIAVLCYHAQLGMQVVIEDYVATAGLRRVGILVCNLLLLAAALIAAGAVVWIAAGW